MQTTDSEPFCSQDADYVQHSTGLVATRNTGELGDFYNAEPITTRQHVEIVIDCEIVRREAQKVTNTRFFQDLMINIVARKRHRASPHVPSSMQRV
jgi:hypothetical protein